MLINICCRFLIPSINVSIFVLDTENCYDMQNLFNNSSAMTTQCEKRLHEAASQNIAGLV
jgi:hypothetical protein